MLREDNLVPQNSFERWEIHSNNA